MNICIQLLHEREKLHKLIESNANYEDILEQSQKVDKILNNFLKKL